MIVFMCCLLNWPNMQENIKCHLRLPISGGRDAVYSCVQRSALLGLFTGEKIQGYIGL